MQYNDFSLSYMDFCKRTHTRANTVFYLLFRTTISFLSYDFSGGLQLVLSHSHQWKLTDGRWPTNEIRLKYIVRSAHEASRTSIQFVYSFLLLLLLLLFHSKICFSALFPLRLGCRYFPVSFIAHIRLFHTRNPIFLLRLLFWLFFFFLLLLFSRQFEFIENIANTISTIAKKFTNTQIGVVFPNDNSIERTFEI